MKAISTFSATVKLTLMLILLLGFGSPKMAYGALSGVYTIDSSQVASATNYRDFISAISDMRLGTRSDGGTPNGTGVAGAVVFNVAAGVYTGQLEITGITGVSATNTITFDGGAGNASTRVVTFSGATSVATAYTIRINNLQYVTIRNLTILGASPSFGWPIHIMNLASNTKIKNCIIGFTGLATSHTNTNFCAVVVNNSTASPTSAGAAVTNIEIDSNTIYGGYGNYFYGSGSASNLNFRNNQVDSSNYYGLYIQGVNRFSVNNNTFTLLENGNINGAGLYVTSSAAGTGFRHEIVANKIINAGSFGVYLTSSGGQAASRSLLANNSLGGGFRNTNAYGIYFGSSTYNWDVYHNSVNLDAVTTNTQNAALYVGNCCTQGATLLDIRNNVFAVTGIGSTAYAVYHPNGYTYAVRDTGSFDYNLYYKEGLSMQDPIIYMGGNFISPTNLIGNQNYNKRSVYANPTFTSNKNLMPFNPCYNGIGIAAITTDVNGASRNNLTPDIGAYELNGVSNDIGVESFTAPVLPFGPGNQSITVVLRNYGSNTVTSANVSYVVNGGTPVAGFFSGSIPPCGSATYTFSGGAQFNFNPNTAYSIKAYTDFPNSSIDARAINDTAYLPIVFTGLSGNYTIDQSLPASATNFVSFTDAAVALNNGGVSGAVTFTVMGNTPYNEQVSLNFVPGVSATNTITFDGGAGNAANRVLTFAATIPGSNHTFRINNTPWVTIRNLTIRGTGASLAWPVHVSGNASSNVTISNCIVNFIGGNGVNGTNDNFTGIVLNGGSGSISTNATFSNLFVDSNTISGGNNGIYVYSQNAENINIRGNIITEANMYGVYVYYLRAFRINGNTVNMRTSGSASSMGIYANFPISSGAYGKEIIGNIVNNAGQYGINCYYLQGGSGVMRAKVMNNAVGGTFRSTDPAGIYFNNYCQNIDVFFNSVNLNNLATSLQSAALKLQSYCTGFIVKNNNLSVSNANSSAYALWSDNTSSFTALDYNNYFKASPIRLLNISGVVYNNTSMIGSTGYNTNSVSVNPSYLSDTDLRSNLNCNHGETINTVTTDLVGNLRNTPPDIGAFENTTALANDLAIVSVVSPQIPMQAGTQDVKVVIKNNGNSAVTTAEVSYSINGATPQTIWWSGMLNACDTAVVVFNATSGPSGADQTYNFLPGISYNIKAYTASPNGMADLNTLNDTLNLGPICASLSGTYTIDSSIAASTTNFVSFTSAVQSMACAGITGPVVFNVAAGTYSGQLEFGDILGLSANNTITFDGGVGNDSTRIITFAATANASRHTVLFNNTRYITMRNLTIQGTGTSFAWPVHVLGNSSYINLANNIIEIAGTGYNGTSTNFITVVMSGSQTSPTSTATFNNISLTNNKLVGGFSNLYMSGNGTNTNLVFNGNLLTNSNNYGTYVSNVIGPKFIGNTIYSRINSTTSWGMFFTSVISNANGTTEVSKNKIFNAGQYGIQVTASNATVGRSVMSNNSIGGNFRNTSPNGIHFTTSNNWDVWFNSVLITNTATSTTTAAAAFLGSGTGFDFRNNNLAVIDSNSGVNYLPFRSVSGVTFTPALNYNNYYRAGTPTTLINVGGTNYTPANFNTAGGANSVSNSSGYVSGDELIPTLSTNNGIQISGINNDVNDSIRNNPPDIGAYEIPSNFNADLGIASMVSPDNDLTVGQNTVNVLVKNFGATTITSFNIRHTVNGLNMQDSAITGVSIAPNDTLRVILTGSKSALISAGVSSIFKAYIHLPNGNVDDNLINDTVTVGPVLGKLKGIYTINPTGSGVNNFVSFRAAAGALNTVGVSGAVTFIVAPATYNEQVNINAVPGASATNTILFDGVDAATRILDTAANTTTNFWTIKLNAAQYVTFKNLTINASGATYGVAVQISGNSHYSKILKCNLNITTGASATTANFIGLLISNSTNITSLSSGIKVDNLQIDSNTFNNGYYGIYAYGSTSSPNSTQNQFTNNAILNSYFYGFYAYYFDALTISNNQVAIKNVGGTNSSAGIYLTSCYNYITGSFHTITSNKITDAGRYGIYIANSGGSGPNSMIANNMIGGGFRNTLTYGVYIGGLQNASFIHNTVNVDFVTTGNQYGAAYITSNTNLVVRNNIFASTGAGLPLYVANAQTGTFELDGNNYYRFGAAAVSDLIYLNNTTYNTNNYIGAGGYNFASVSVNPSFVSNYDLHITSACNGRVSRLGNLLTDIDGNTRSALTNMGADEGVASANDVGVVSIMPFSSGLQDVKVVIKNFGSNVLTGANISYSVNGNIPRVLAWSGSLNPCDTVTVVFGGVNQFNFLSGVTYTLTAYTSLPNLAADSKNSNDTSILGPTCVFLSGNYTVDASGSGPRNFTTITQAVTALNCGGVNGPVNISVAPGTYNEQVIIGNVVGASATNTITFDGDSAATRIIEFNPTVNTAAFTVKFEGASNVTFRNLTIRSTGTSGYAGAVQIASNCNNIKLTKNLIQITGPGTTSPNQSYFPVLVSGSTTITSPSVQLVNTTNIEIDSNTITSGHTSVWVYGNSSAYTNNIVIRNNTMDSAYLYGTYIYFADRTVFDGNVLNMRVMGATASYGLYLSNINASGTNFISVNGNQIYNAGISGIYGYFANTTSSTSRSKMTNNVIGGNFRSAQANPLYMQYCYYWDIWHNSIALNLPTNSEQYSTAYFTNCTQLDVRNNHFANIATSGSGLPFFGAATNQFIALDFNNYYNQSGSNLLNLGGISYNQSTITNGGGFNANPRYSNPGFSSVFNLSASNACINGVAIAAVPTDIIGITRNTPPDIGAYEFTGTLNNDIGVSTLLSPTVPFAPGSYPIQVRINNYGANVVTSATIKYSINNAAPVSYTYSGTLNPCDTVSLTISASNVNFALGTAYSIKVWSELPNGQVDGNTLNDTLNAGACAALVAGTYTINPAGSGANNFTSFAAAADALNCGGITGPVRFEVSAGTYTEQFTINNVVGASAINTITVDGVDKATRTIQFNPTNNMAAHTVRIANTPFVTIRNLTIISQGASFGNPMHIMGGSDGANIVNNNITFSGNAQASTGGSYIAVLVNNEANIYNPSLTGTKANNVTIDSNNISYGYYGVYVTGLTQTPYSQGFVMRRNNIDSSYYYGTYLYYISGVNVSGNNVNMRSGNVNGQGFSLNQLYNNTGASHNIVGNKIKGAGRYGMYFYFASNSNTALGNLINNSIAGGFTSTTASGIYMQYSTYWNIWHNTVWLDVATTSANSSSAFSAINSSTNLDIRNNHFINSATSGSGLAFYLASTPTVLNYNNYFNAASNTLLYANANYTSTNFVNGGGYNANSFNVNPNFTAGTDLNAGGCFKGINLSAVTTDINGKVRNTIPDIGAYESSALDVSVVSLTSPVQPVSAGLQNVSVDVKNLGGSTITSLTVTYNINNTGNVTQTFTGLSILPCSTSTVTFTGANQFNFPSGRSIVTVFTSNPNGLTDNDYSNDTLKTSLCGPLNGIYTINPNITSASNFTSFNDAISSMLCAGITGPVTFNVAPGTYNEQVRVPNISGVSSFNTITFRGNPSAVNSTVLTFASNNTNARHTVKLDSANHVSFEYLTIRTEGASFGWGVHVWSTSKFNSIKGCVIDIAGATAPNSTSTNFAGIVANGSNTNVTTSGLITDLVIDSNQIINGYYGVVVYGNTTNTDSSIVITRNNISNSYYYGAYLYSVEGMSVNNNRIALRNNNTNSQGIYMATSTAYSTDAAFEINANRITSVGAYGIYLNAVNGIAGASAKMYNNMIGGGFTSSNATGLYLNNSSNWDVYHNSINLDMATNSINYACVYMSGTISNTRMKNNHFAYTGLGGSGLTMYVANNNMFAPGGLNYNNYYKAGIAATENLLYIQGFYTPNNYINGGGYNQNSFNRLPGYRNNLDLATIDGCFNGDSLGVLTDIDGELRGSFGDIGADEVTDANNDLGVLALIQPTIPLSTGLQDISVIVKNFGTNTIYNGTVNYSINGGAPVSLVFNDTLQPCDTTIITFTGVNQFNFTAGIQYQIKAYTTLPNDSNDINNVNDTFATANLCIALAGTYTIDAAGSGANNFVSFQGALDALACSGVSGPVVFNVAAGTYTEQLVVPAIAGASVVNTITFDGGAGNASTRILTYGATTTNARQTVRFSGTQYVAFNNLTIRNTGTSWAWPVHVHAGSKNIGLTNNIIEITGAGATTSSQNFINVVVSASLTSPSSAIRVDSLTIDSNIINGGYASVYSYNQQSLFNNFNGNTFNNPLVYGLYLYNAYELKFRNNIVNMSATGDVASVGLYLFVLGTINNTVHEITGNRIANSGQYGIYLYNSSGAFGNPSLLVNNFIGGGFRNTTQHGGVFAEYAYNWNIWFNTINLDTISNAQFGAMHAQNSSNLDIRNNIFAVTNPASNAIPYYGATTGNASQLNYNNYYKAGNPSTLIFNGVALSPSTYIGANGFNLNSFSRDPLFVGAIDLHVGNGCNNGITIAGVTTDIDGQTRTSPPDVGADEVTTGFIDNIGVTQILTPSTPLATGTSDLVVIVSNLGNNLVTSANINYTINGGTPVTINYNDTILPCDTAIITFTGAQAYNFVQGTSYTIKAYTSLPNGVNDNNLVDDTTTLGPLCPAMSGNYTIDANGSGATNFTTITAAVNALQCAGISDDVVFTLANGVYNEQVVINNVAGSNDTNTVSFIGQSKTGVVVTFAANNINNAHTLKINSASNIIIQNLTMQSTGTTMGVPLHIFGSANNVKIKNNNIVVGGAGATSTSTNFIAVLVNANANIGLPTNGTGSFINNLQIDSNNIRSGYYGILAYGRSNTPYSNDVYLRGNIIDSSYYYGIYAYYLSGTKILSNNLNMRVVGTTGSMGIYLYQCYNNTGNRHQIHANRIYDAGSYGFYAYFSSGNNTNPNEFYNNMVGGNFRSSSATPAYFQYSNYWNIYHNSLNLAFATSNAQYSVLTATNTTNLRIVNNILSYNATSGSGLPLYTANAQTVINYNNYVNSANTNLLNVNGTTYTAANYVGGGGYNANGFNTVSGFTSNRNLSLTAATSKGDATLGITTDIDGQQRQTPPDIGADEYFGVMDIGVVAIDSPTTNVFCGGNRNVVVKLRNFGNQTVNSAIINVAIDGILLGSYNWSGTLAPGATTGQINVGSFAFTSGVYNLAVYSSLPNFTNDTIVANDTAYQVITTNLSVTPTISLAASQTTICSGQEVTLIATYSGGGATPSIQWRNNGITLPFNGDTLRTTTLANNDSIVVILSSSATCASPINVISNSVKMNVGTTVPAMVSMSASATTVCAGQNVTFTATPTNGGFTPSFAWFKNGVQVGTDSSVYVAINPLDGDSINVVLTSSLGCASPAKDTANGVRLTVNPLLLPTATINATATTLCAGTQVTVAATTTNGGSFPFYQWKRNGVNIGTNNDTLVINNLANNDSLELVLTSNATCATPQVVSSNKIQFTVNPIVTPSVSISSNTNNVCLGTQVNFNAIPVNVGVNATYSWRVNSVQVATGATYSSSALNNTDTVSLVVTTDTVCAVPSVVGSNKVIMQINNFVTPAVTFTASSDTVCANTPVTFIATPTNGGLTPSYQWKLNGNNVGTDSSRFTTVLNNNDSVTVVLTSNASCLNQPTATTSYKRTVVNPLLPTNVFIHSTGTVVCAGGSILFDVSSVNGGTNPIYQWKRNGVNVGINADTFRLQNPVNGDSISVVLTSNAVCASPAVKESEKIAVVVNPILTPTVSIVANKLTICQGDSVTYTATPTNGGLTPGFKWYKNGVQVANNVTSYTAAQLTSNDSVWVELNSSINCVTSTAVLSNKIKVTVNAIVTPTVTIQANQTTICAGTSVTFTANATDTGLTPTYQWKRNGNNVGSNSRTYVATSLNNNDSVWVVVTSSATCATVPTATSAKVGLQVTTPVTPNVSVNVSASNICAGTTVTYTATATNAGATPTFAWYKNGLATGNTNTTYVTNSLVDGDQVICIMTATPGCLTQSADTGYTAAMVVKTPPAKPVVVKVNNDSLSTTFASSGYQWFRNGSAISGATTRGLKVPSNGYYQVRVDSIGCSSLSDSLLMNNVGLKEANTISNVMVYPNPTRGFATVEANFTNKANTTITVVDMFGRLITTIPMGEITSLNDNVNLSNLADGVYFIQIQHGDDVVTQRVVKAD